MNSNIRADIVNAFSCIAQHAIRSGTWYTWRVRYPFIIENAATRLGSVRPRDSGRIEKRAEKASEIQGQSQLSTYLLVLRLSNWLGTYVAESRKNTYPEPVSRRCVSNR